MTLRSSGARKFQLGVRTPPVDWIFFASDTHYTPNQNQDAGDPIPRLISALNTLPGTPYPLGGVVGQPLAIINGGDSVHEGEESMTRFASHRWDLHIDGNHDVNATRDLVVQRFGSLTWGRKVGRVWIQALTETYIAQFNTFPPDVTQINGPVAASVFPRPINEPMIFLVHRSVDPGYGAEWDPAALIALDNLMASRHTILLLHGHNHYSQHYTWVGPSTGRSWRVFSPGSNTQAPLGGAPPYTTVYPESFIVMRIGRGYVDLAAYVYGFDLNRPLSGGTVGGPGWAPGTWSWSERIRYEDRETTPL